MARNRNTQNKKHKHLTHKNKGDKMYDTYNDGYPVVSYNKSSFQATPSTNQVKIVDQKSDKHFALLLSTQQSIEEFQIKSGMLKPFTTEYQYHYWALVARIQIEEEIFDIAIPTVLFNYDQEVNGSAVDFHLNDVEKASNENAATADTIANIIVESDFGKYLTETFQGQLEWMNVPMNTCHVHPGQLSTFSGTDYCKTITDPGICFPLSEPQGQPSFSSIICHQGADNVGKVVRTEYRHATKVNNDIIYKHGTCLAYWKGHTIKGHKTKLGLIKSIFTGKEYDEKPDIVKPHYINKDGLLADTFADESILNQIIQEFNKLNFSPYTEDIKADRIQKFKQKTLYGNAYGNSYGTTHYHRVNPSAKNTSLPATATLTLVELRQKLIAHGYASTIVYGWDWQKCRQMYDNLIEIEKAKQSSAKVNVSTSSIQTDMTPDEMVKFLLVNGHKAKDIKGKSLAELNYLFEETLLEIEEFEAEMAGEVSLLESTKVNESKPDLNKNPQVRQFLNTYGISDFKIDKMSNAEISAMLEDFNWMDDESLFDY